MKVMDIHIHGTGGYATRTADPSDLLKLAEIQGAHGVSAIIPTIYPAGIDEMRANMEAVKKAMELQTSKGPAAEILGINLEGPFLNPSFAGALNPRTFLPPTEHTYREITDGFESIVRVVTISPELDGALRLIRLLADKGVAVSMGHTNATMSEAEAAYGQGARCITHLFNAMRPFHHREPGIAGFGLLNPSVYVELIGDPFHLHQGTVDLVFRVKDPSKIIIISDSVKETPDITQPAQAGLKDARGRLQGGAMNVKAAAVRLIEAGFDRDLILGCVGSNPATYLGI
jgi:N-acetylglucosamine-6-phosphate deacetylase